MVDVMDSQALWPLSHPDMTDAMDGQTLWPLGHPDTTGAMDVKSYGHIMKSQLRNMTKVMDDPTIRRIWDKRYGRSTLRRSAKSQILEFRETYGRF